MQEQIKARKNKQAQEETRLRVVDYLRKGLGTQKAAAEIFSVTEKAVNKIWGRYKQEGKRGLYSKNRGARSGKKINGKQAGRGYAPKGETPVVKSTGQRFSLNMVSAISNKGHLQFMVIEKFNGEVFTDFLKRMIRYSKEKIFLITDGHPAHKTRKLLAWLEDNKNRVEVFFIPPYRIECAGIFEPGCKDQHHR
ncbi:MAG: transposase [Chitinophagaceae bacterium]